MTDQHDSTVAAGPRTTRSRRILTGVALVLACLSIVVTTIGVWTHQVALNTNRFSTLIESVVTDPALADPVSARLSDQVVDAIGVQARLESRLPDALKPLAGALTTSVRDAIEARLRVAIQDPRIQAAIVNSLSFTHEHVVRLLRGDTEIVAVVDGYVTLDVFPLVGAALTELQTMGIIPADVQLPDLTAPEAPEALAQRLETALGVTLPPDFGTIRLMPSDRLEAASSVVRIFDLVIILLVILSIALVALTLWLARDRRRMLIYLGIGTIIAFLIARFAVRTAEDVIVGGIADTNIAGATRALVDTTLQDLRGLTLIIVVATAILAIAAYLWGRPKWVMTTTAAVGDAAGRAGSAVSTSVEGAAGRAPDRDKVAQTVRQNPAAVERIGIGVIVFILVWLAVGLEIALLGAALIVGLQVVLRALSSDDADTADDAADSHPTPV